MGENIMNQSTVNYTFSGSTETKTETSNISTVTIKDENSLYIEKTAQTSTFVPGGTVNYTVTITNNGTSYFSGVRITDNLGGNGYLTYVAGSARLYYYQQLLAPEIASTNPLVFTLSPLSSGQTMILTYTCRVSSTLPSTVNSIINSVEGIGYTYSSSVKAYSSCEITRSSVADLAIVKTSSAISVAVGELYSYYITLSNQGTTLANVTSITDTLPANFKVSSIKLQIGTGSQQTLNPTDYQLDSSNNLVVPSSTGPTITVPASGSAGSGKTVLTITGYVST